VADPQTLTVAVTGLNATDNPAPGVAVIRAIREAPGFAGRIVGLAYDALDPGNYLQGIADAVYLMPYPSQGAEAVLDRLLYIHARTPLDVIVPTLDAELPAYIRIADQLLAHGIHTFLPSEEGFARRSKARFHELQDKLGIPVPKSRTIADSADVFRLHEEFSYPLMVKGQFYDAYLAHSPMEAEALFQKVRAKWGLPVVVQEFVAGEEYDVVALGDGEGGLLGAVPMRKMQLTDKGKAWGGITIADPALERFLQEAMSRLKWRGPLELEVMRAKKDGRLLLLEINPRFPAWVYLAVGAGQNLPWAVVELALGRKVAPLPPYRVGTLFLRHSHDVICPLADYENLSIHGELHREVADAEGAGRGNDA